MRTSDSLPGTSDAFPSETRADAVTCFETIEHVDNPRQVVEEVVRILKPGGLFLVSTPNKSEYTDQREYRNEFHTHEFYPSEFEHLLGECFEERIMLGHRLVAGSLMWTLDDKSAHEPRSRASNILVAPAFDEEGISSPQSMTEPMYLIAACRMAGPPDEEVPWPAISVLVDPRELLLEAFRGSLNPPRSKPWRTRLASQDAELERARRQLAEYEDRLAESQVELVTPRGAYVRIAEQDVELAHARGQNPRA